MLSCNLAVSLFDPQLDHIEDNASNSVIAKSRSPLLGIPALTKLPIVTKYIILVASENLKAAERIKPLLETAISKVVEMRVADERQRDAYRRTIGVNLVSIDYSDIWNLASCSNDIGNALAGHLKAGAGIRTLVLNLVGGTAAARTALFLSITRFLHGKTKPELRLVLGRPGQSTRNQLTCIQFSPNSPRVIGLLAQGIGTQNARFVSSLNRLEQVLLSSRYERILITGPTGAGKSELAKLIIAYMQALHPEITEENSINQNVAAIAPTLIESELFGHETGAFSGAVKEHKGIFERANKGIVFLDEIGELPTHLQAKLLTVLDGAPFFKVGGTEPITSKFLFLCGTNVDLQAACEKDASEKGAFRRDLFERLRSWHVEVPAIHDRPEDLEVALQRERGEWRRKTGRDVQFERRGSVKDFFLQQAKRYSWPGNFREFHGLFSHLAMFAGDSGITQADVETEFQKHANELNGMGAAAQTTHDGVSIVSHAFDMAEMARLACALDVCRQSKTASEAGAILFAARAESARLNGTMFNGAACLSRLFAQFGLRPMFKHGAFSVEPKSR